MFITMSSVARRASPLRLLLAAGLIAALAMSATRAANASERASEHVPLPDAIMQEASDWRSLGSGNLRWLGFSIYRASLWAPGDERVSLEAPFALAIRYERSISSQRLVQTSLDEMKRLGTADEASRTAWQALLEQAFPAVAAGEVIVGVNQPGEGVSFFHQGRLTAQIVDVGFAQAFFAIWLDERTREPGLRASLMGEREFPADG